MPVLNTWHHFSSTLNVSHTQLDGWGMEDVRLCKQLFYVGFKVVNVRDLNLIKVLRISSKTTLRYSVDVEDWEQTIENRSVWRKKAMYDGFATMVDRFYLSTKTQTIHFETSPSETGLHSWICLPKASHMRSHDSK